MNMPKSKTVPGFDRTGDRPMMVYHTFQVGPDGQLQHLIDNNLRATVPPEGWADYVREWPEAAEIVDSLIKPTVAADPVPPVVASLPGGEGLVVPA
jgi:hypothetical protein